MRYRLMATYRGAPYEAGIGPADGAVVLFAACPPPEELGFEPATGHWRKELRIQDVQAVWQSRPVGTFRGDSCIVLDDLGDRLHIGYLGHDAYRAEQLGYWQVDRGVFELVAGRDEVTDIIEERADYQPGVTPQAGYPALPPPAEPGYPRPAAQVSSGYPLSAVLPEAPRMPPPDGGVALPQSAAEAPLPLEAQAMRAASAASRRDQPAPPAERIPPTADPGFAGASGKSAMYAAPVSPAMPSSPTVPAQGPDPALRGEFYAPDGSYSPRGPYAPDEPYSPEAYSPAGSYSAADIYSPGTGATIAPGTATLPRTAAPLGTATLPGLPAPPDTTAPGAAAGPDIGTAPGMAAAPPATSAPAVLLPGTESPRRRRSAGRRMATERIFGELASLAAIPAASYSVGEEVDGAMCLLETADGFEVFSSAGGARHEVRVFSDEESACFYLFGVLAADAVRTGGLVPGASRVQAATSVADAMPGR